MTPRKKQVRRSVTLPREIDTRVQNLARRQNWSANQAIENLIEAGLAAKESERKQFFALAERLRASSDEAEVQRIKDELARMTFGE